MNQSLSQPRAFYQSFEEQSDPAQVAPRLAALRQKLAGMGIDAFLVPRADVHQGEYVPARDARLAYVTGFTGSAGLAVIARDKAVLLVDGRYTLQAPTQTDTALVDIADSGRTKPEDWIGRTLARGSVVGFDPWLHTPGQIEALEKALESLGIALRPVDDNPVDAIWADRPAPPEGAIEAFGANRAGKSAEDKLAELRTALAGKGADAVVLTLPESICWLFNIRGRDIPHNPFVLAFAIVPREGRPTIFLAPDKLNDESHALLGPLADLTEKSAFPAALDALAALGTTVWIDPATAPAAVKSALSGRAALVEARDPTALPKAKKNPAELAGMREAQALDSVAMCRFLAWFDRTAPKGGLTEIAIVEQLETFRRESGQLADVSFETIAGAGPNGAIVHYRVSNATNRTLVPGELMLVDSGAQYLSGTTDITRTMASGPVTAAQKDRFTRVLKGMIAISRLVFPKGTAGNQIDILARHALWQVGLNYAHGTGHGVGAFLSVHEGPAGISPRYTIPFEAGMILSNEPGYYEAGAYGIRIENLVAVVESEIAPDFLGFETLTYAPIDTRLVAPDLLTPEERDWLNAYHAEVARRVAGWLDAEDGAWLARATAPI